MMRTGLSLSFILLLCLCSLACQAEKPEVDLQEGLWEITTVMKMPGITMDISPLKTTQCITQADLIPQTRQPDQPDQQCEIADLTINGNTVIYDMVCAAQDNTMQAHSSITYEKNRLQGKMTATMQPSNMTMNYTLTGKRIADCSR